ncbi:c-type cytochrome [Hoeflea sp. WL0058]|uniref:C-type cytochrome n=1 Tax=Flavimaribacter sediminis TaxID=2865987 RepID=A0AAE2ZK67_9HYPH|nr:c-type cytochrome [Flavimaribacter sediminis]MBW8636177.1 c-type cytochrome [Flavimaribacter sediminis]
MPMRSGFAAFALLGLATTASMSEGPGLGVPLSRDDIPDFAIHIMPDGTGLPDGSGSAAEGAELYEFQCAFCHGETGVEGPIEPLVASHPDEFSRAAGVYWPHATTLFDYIRRAMPFHAPKSLEDDEIYALTAYILARNGVIDEGDIMDATTLPSVEMPARDKTVDLWSLQGDTPF